jgi:hypothetical protein
MVALKTGLKLPERGSEGYERARLASVWNCLKPNRFPAAIACGGDAPTLWPQSAWRASGEAYGNDTSIDEPGRGFSH